MELCLRPALLILVIALLLANLILIVVSTYEEDTAVPVTKTGASGLRDAYLDNNVTLDNATTNDVTVSEGPHSPGQIHSVEAPDCNCTKTPNEFISDDDLLYCNSHNMLLDRADGIGLTSKRRPRQKQLRYWVPYTITPSTFQKFHETTCSNMTDLTQALRYGSRKWIKTEAQDKPALERELEQCAKQL